MRHRRRLANAGEQLFNKYFKELLSNFDTELMLQNFPENGSERELAAFIEKNFEEVMPSETVHLARELLPSKYKSLLYLEYGLNPDDSDWAEVNQRFLDRY